MEFKKLSDVEMVAEPVESANVLIEEDGVIKKAPKSAVGGGGGVTSWNDLTDKPFGDIYSHFKGGDPVVLSGWAYVDDGVGNLYPVSNQCETTTNDDFLWASADSMIGKTFEIRYKEQGDDVWRTEELVCCQAYFEYYVGGYIVLGNSNLAVNVGFAEECVLDCTSSTFAVLYTTLESPDYGVIQVARTRQYAGSYADQIEIVEKTAATISDKYIPNLTKISLNDTDCYYLSISESFKETELKSMVIRSLISAINKGPVSMSLYWTWEISAMINFSFDNETDEYFGCFQFIDGTNLVVVEIRINGSTNTIKTRALTTTLNGGTE